MQVEIWSDVICPWCYIGKRNFEAALAGLPGASEVTVVWRSFELDPQAPARYGETLEQMLSRKYGVSLQEAAAMNARVTAVAASAGLQYRLADALPGNTLDAHRILHFALARQAGGQVMERLMQAYFTEGLPVGERDALVRLAGECGLDTTEVSAMLESDAYIQEVRADEARAATLGINSVPHFLIDGRVHVSGAQAVESFKQALQQAMA